MATIPAVWLYVLHSYIYTTMLISRFFAMVFYSCKNTYVDFHGCSEHCSLILFTCLCLQPTLLLLVRQHQCLWPMVEI